MNFSNQTVIVTGGGTGIGLSIVKAYLDEGANVVICGRREAILEKSVKSLIKIKEEYQDRLFSVKADMSVDKQVINLFKRAKENFSSINILINNAGVWNETPLLECTSDEIDFTFIQEDTLKIEIPDCHCIFFDTDHTYKQLSQELELHGNKADRYLLFHDTMQMATEVVPTINEFLEKNKEWLILRVDNYCHGLTVLGKTTKEHVEAATLAWEKSKPQS